MNNIINHNTNVINNNIKNINDNILTHNLSLYNEFADTSFYHIMSLSRSKDRIDNNIKCYSLISSSFFLYGKEIKLLNLACLPKKLEENSCLNIKNLNVFLIDQDYDSEFIMSTTISSLPYIGLHEYSNNMFFGNQSNSFIKFVEGNMIEFKDMIFILKNFDWKQTQILFRNINMIISGGATTKRHILSPNYLRLALFILAATDCDKYSISKSFHSAFSNGDGPVNTGSKEININSKEGIDIINHHRTITSKKEFHTSATTNNIIKDITRQPSTNMYNLDFSSNQTNIFLNRIEAIVNDNKYSPIQKQTILENSWTDIVKDLYEDIEFLKSKHSHSLVNKLIRIKRTLDILEKKGNIQKSFPTIHNHINNIKTLLLAYGVATNGVLLKIGYLTKKVSPYTLIGGIRGFKTLFFN
uniref:RNA polymerase n=1 Tax=Daedaleopsis nitida TaxID=1140402 RepID=UPI0030E252A6